MFFSQRELKKVLRDTLTREGIRELKAGDAFVITDVRLPKRSGSTKAFLARDFNVKQDALGNTDGNILFIFPDWYFGAVIFSVVNTAAKRRSKFPFDRSQ